MQRVATRARALGLLAVCALVQSTSQPDLLIIVRHLADQVARFWCPFSLHQRLPDGEPVALISYVAFKEAFRTEES